jgi:AcrR family transcriptional regulator
MAQMLKDEIKEKIQKSAIELFTMHGFKDTSIKQIADKAGISVGNVYHYYANKEELYSLVIQGVYDGVQSILQDILLSEKYHINLIETNSMTSMFEPMMSFIRLYRKEKAVFTLLLKSEKDHHYKETIELFIHMLRDYFLRFWGNEITPAGMSFVEASALSNAIVFAVIDLLNHVEDDALEAQLMEFLGRIVKGYFYVKHSEEALL